MADDATMDRLDAMQVALEQMRRDILPPSEAAPSDTDTAALAQELEAVRAQGAAHAQELTQQIAGLQAVLRDQEEKIARLEAERDHAQQAIVDRDTGAEAAMRTENARLEEVIQAYAATVERMKTDLANAAKAKAPPRDPIAQAVLDVFAPVIAVASAHMAARVAESRDLTD